MSVPTKITSTVSRLKREAAARDRRMLEVRALRAGEIETLAPDLFSEDWPKPVIANWIESAARDLAETIAPLPALNCASRGMQTESDKKRAATKNKVGHYMWGQSYLATEMLEGADRYLTYGFLPFYVEIDFARRMPVIRVEDPFGAYFENDRWGKTRIYLREWRDSAGNVATQFPEHAERLLMQFGKMSNGEEIITVVRYCDDKTTYVYCPDKDVVLASYPNACGCPVQVAKRPGLDGESRGQFDQVLWVQLARHRMALLAIEAGTKSVQAPVIVPNDLVELPVGPDSVWRTDQGDQVRRLSLEVPSSAFALADQLSDELKLGSRFPEGRMGGVDASVITGRGIQALMGGFDTQIKTAQTVIGQALARVTEIAFKMDVAFFGGELKQIQGTATGESYQIKYDPAKVIGDNPSVDVTYGYAAGLAPNQAAVLLLQLRGDALIDRNTVRRQLPFDIDVEQMERALDVQDTQDALKQGVFGYLAQVGMIAAQGGDPMPVFLAAARIIKDRQNGRSIEDAVIEAFTPPEPTPEEAAMQAQAQTPEGALSPGGGGAPPGVPGQAQMGPGGLPDIQTLMAGLRGGAPVMDAGISRKRPL